MTAEGRAPDIERELAAFRRRFERLQGALRECAGRLEWATPNRVLRRRGPLCVRRFEHGAAAGDAAGDGGGDGGGDGAGDAAGVPALVVYSHVNSPHVLDLMPEHSLLLRLAEAGNRVYLLDWGAAGDDDRNKPLAGYVLDDIDWAVDAARQDCAAAKVALVGVCQGGTFSLCHAAAHPGKVSKLAALITPVDFHAGDNVIARWSRHIDTARLARAPNIPGPAVAGMFQLLRPFADMRRQVRTVADAPENLELTALMDRWMASGPAQPARAFAEFVRWFFQDNRLVRGELTLGGRALDLTRIAAPVFNLHAAQDHIVPPQSAAALRRFIAPERYRERRFAGGHIGLLVSRRAQQGVLVELAEWLAGE